MAKTKTTSVDYYNLILETIKDKYLYFLIGATIVILGGTIVFNLLKTQKGTVTEKAEKTTKQEQTTNKESLTANNKYVVKKGDYLWTIAERKYGSGYNYVDIAKTNKLKNEDLLFVGQVLTLPEVEAKKPTTGQIVNVKTKQVKKSFNQYMVQKGDNLWKIAVKAYGDGYAWVKIAKKNKLKNPNIIFEGQKLLIQ